MKSWGYRTEKMKICTLFLALEFALVLNIPEILSLVQYSWRCTYWTDWLEKYKIISGLISSRFCLDEFLLPLTYQLIPVQPTEVLQDFGIIGIFASG